MHQEVYIQIFNQYIDIANCQMSGSNCKFPTSFILYYLYHVLLIVGVAHYAQQLKYPNVRSIQLFWVLTLLTMLFSIFLHIKKPGYVQTKPHIDLQHQKQNHHSPQNPLEIKQNIVDDAIQTNLQKRYCRLCNCSQPLRAKHCHECGKCVLTFDHHCFLLSNCIGEKNRHFFYLFILAQIFQLSFSLGLIIIKIRFLHADLLLLAVIAGLCIGIALCIILLLFHTYLMFRGITTWEYFSWQYISYLSGFQKNKSPFSKGVCNNIWSYWSIGCKSESQEWNHNQNY